MDEYNASNNSCPSSVVDTGVPYGGNERRIMTANKMGDISATRDGYFVRMCSGIMLLIRLVSKRDCILALIYVMSLTTILGFCGRFDMVVRISNTGVKMTCTSLALGCAHMLLSARMPRATRAQGLHSLNLAGK